VPQSWRISTPRRDGLDDGATFAGQTPHAGHGKGTLAACQAQLEPERADRCSLQTRADLAAAQPPGFTAFDEGAAFAGQTPHAGHGKGTLAAACQVQLEPERADRCSQQTRADFAAQQQQHAESRGPKAPEHEDTRHGPKGCCVPPQIQTQAQSRGEQTKANRLAQQGASSSETPPDPDQAGGP